MITILTIIGARPQIIKAAAISRTIKNKYKDKIRERILHTGQHYDENMSQIFFDELQIPTPDYNLHIGSAPHGEQSAKMIEGIEKILLEEHFDGVIVYGDTNSTLAGAIAASKLHIPIFHVEAGLRSDNMAMPEEINRIVCDHVSSVLFAPTQAAVDNLKREGLIGSKATFLNGKCRETYNSGDVMYDNSIYFSTIAERKSVILASNNLKKDQYILATIHRSMNTDNKERLSDIFRALLHLSEQNDIVIALPLHPRTQKMMQVNLPKELYNKITSNERMRILPPVSFLDMICLEKNSRIVVTDSGGVQKEAFFNTRPCLILRAETEWMEIVEQESGILCDADYKKIMDAYKILSNKTIVFPPLFGDGNASGFIIAKIVAYYA